MNVKIMSDVYTYLFDKYDKTGFRFCGLVEVQNKFGKEIAKSELNHLHAERKIVKRKGANETLIELIINNNETNRD